MKQELVSTFKFHKLCPKSKLEKGDTFPSEMLYALLLFRLRDDLASHCWSDYEEKGLGFNICKHLKMTLMTLYSQINPIRHHKVHMYLQLLHIMGIDSGDEGVVDANVRNSAVDPDAAPGERYLH